MSKAPRQEPRGPAILPPAALTDREEMVMQCVADGWRNHEIGQQLGISVRTVEKHLSNIFLKFDVRSRISAARLYLQWERPGEKRSRTGGARR